MVNDGIIPLPLSPISLSTSYRHKDTNKMEMLPHTHTQKGYDSLSIDLKGLEKLGLNSFGHS